MWCAGLKRGERKAIAVRPQAMLEAKDLQRCDLSDFLEARIAKALDEDRNMRAQRKGVPVDQVIVHWTCRGACWHKARPRSYSCRSGSCCSL